MALILSDEGRAFLARYLLRGDLSDRDSGLEIGLLCNTQGDNTLGLAGVAEPVGVGYGRVPLDDLLWSVDALGHGVYPQVEFMAGAGGWNPYIQGYLIATRSRSGTPRLLGFEFDRRQLIAPGVVNRIGNVVTIVTPQPHGLQPAGFVNVRGANQPEYNGVFAVSVTDPNSFTYTVSGSPATPATGSILVNRCFQLDVGARYTVTPDLSVVTAGG